MVKLKTPEQIETMREGGRILATILHAVKEKAVIGASTKDLDDYVNELCKKYDVVPVFLNYTPYGANRPYPASICISLNDEVVHGIPSAERIIKEGDLVKLDIGMRFEGMVSDMARTVTVGTVSSEAQRLLDVTRESLERGIAELRPGAAISRYASAVQSFVEANGFSVVRDLVGHGVGHELHEDPQVPNYTSRHMHDFVIEEGMTLALEPMINAGTFAVRIAPDDWTFITSDGKLSAHFEDTVVITARGAEILTKV